MCSVLAALGEWEKEWEKEWEEEWEEERELDWEEEWELDWEEEEEVESIFKSVRRLCRRNRGRSAAVWKGERSDLANAALSSSVSHGIPWHSRASIANWAS